MATIGSRLEKHGDSWRKAVISQIPVVDQRE